MTPPEMQDLIGQILQTQRQFQDNQRQLQDTYLQANIRLTQTEAIANSNARAIEALANESGESRRLIDQTQSQLIELTRIVSQFAEATNACPSILENKEN